MVPSSHSSYQEIEDYIKNKCIEMEKNEIIFQNGANIFPSNIAPIVDVHSIYR